MRLPIAVTAFAVAFGVLASAAFAAGFFHSVRDKTTVKECGACHMVYPPALLPARSWQLIIGHLDNHFGEDATLPDPARQHILNFYMQNAGDSQTSDGWFMRGVPDTATPPRITAMPFWRAIHGGFPVSAFKRTNVRKKGNCIGCHG